MKEKLTISDIARMANVSKTTVSFILNNKGGVSEATRKKVLEVIEQTSYKPTLNSRRLFYKKSFTVAMVCDKSAPIFDNVFYYGIMSSLFKRCMHYNYSLVYLEYGFRGEELSLPDNILNKDVDGLIFLRDIPPVLCAKLRELEIPFVVVDSHSQQEDLYTVTLNYCQSVRTAMDYLFAQGHRKIGCLCNHNSPYLYDQCRSSYEQALQAAGLPVQPRWVLDQVTDRASLEEQISRLLELEDRPTAMYCMDDALALELIRYLQKRGLRLPEDLSIISVDDIIFAGQLYPGLTTISVDKKRMGTAAIDILMNLINGEPARSVVISSNQLVIRESVAPLP